MPDPTTSIYAFTKPTVGGDSGTWGGLLNTNFDSLDDVIARPKVPFNSPTVGATTTLDCSLARVFVFTVSQATTLAFSNVPSSSFACAVRLLITNGSAFTLTWPAAVTWLSGVAPTLQASGVDVVDLVTKDGGVTWYGAPVSPNTLIGTTVRAGIGTSTSTAKAPVVVHQTNAGTGATGESTLDSYTLPANALSGTNDTIRITLWGQGTTHDCHIRAKFGATYVLNAGDTTNITAGNAFRSVIELRRSGAATQVASGLHFNSATPTLERSTPAETLSGAVTIAITGYTVTTGGTLTVDGVRIEVLSA